MIDTRTVPASPGCYLFMGTDGVLYIGKAKHLRKRVSSYFRQRQIDEKTRALVKRITDVKCFVTKNEIEALILENTLIKKHQPPYNISLKDSRRYAYLQLTDELYPRLLLSRKRTGGGKFFGPFVSGQARDQIQSTLIKAFKIRTCKRLPKKACLRYHIGLCDAPCIQAVTRDVYMAGVTQAAHALGGQTKDLLKTLSHDMQTASKEQRYEHALRCRDQIAAVEYLEHKQVMDRDRQVNEDVFCSLVRNGTVYCVMFNVSQGTLDNKQVFEFPYQKDWLEEFLSRYYADHPLPGELILSTVISPAQKAFFKQQRKGSFTVTVPKRGEKRTLLDIARKNIEATFFGEESRLQALGKSLGLQDIPRVMECFDISHLGGTQTVASMVQFRNGLPHKAGYRRFKIRTVSGGDDFTAMQEVVGRRYSRLKREQEPLPDLVVIDGGKGQLNAALEALKEAEVSLPVISIAKEFEEVYVPGRSSPVSMKKDGLLLIQRIRDEAHRFAVKYQRVRRSKEAFA